MNSAADPAEEFLNLYNNQLTCKRTPETYHTLPVINPKLTNIITTSLSIVQH